MDRLNDILPHIKEQRCGLFIGAGLSRIAGCYDWDSIVKEMLDHPLIVTRGIKKEELMTNLRNEELILFCKRIFAENNGEETFWGIARRAMYPEPELFVKDYLPLIKKLKQIKPPPRIILTTNIDDCLESTREYEFDKVYFRIEDFTLTKLDGSGIFHIHGYKEEFQESLLSREKYIPRYREIEFQNFIKSFFSKYSVIFLGYSLRDGEITDLLLETKNERTRHFFLIPEEDGISPSQISAYYDLYGLTTVIYGRRKDFSKIITEWIDKYFEATSLTSQAVDIPNG